MPDPASGLDADIAICGAGPVGAACALFLLERGIAAARIALIDARSREAAATEDRTIAISQGSATLLERLGAWAGVERHATPIETIHVSHRGRFGQTLIDRRDYGTAALGYVIRLGDLTAALDATLRRRGLETRRSLRVVGVATADEGLEVALRSTTADPTPSHLSARHVVHAEGGLFGGQARRDIHRDYDQVAVTAFVTAVDPPSTTLARTAFERFTEDGPIALLPAAEPLAGGGVREGWSLVWCGRPADASDRLGLDEPAFLRALHDAFGDRLGRFASVGPRSRYALGLNAVATTARLRSATAAEFAIGNAAQTLHPVAGQGLNLGFRDAHDFAAAFASSDAARARRRVAEPLAAAAETAAAASVPATRSPASTAPALSPATTTAALTARTVAAGAASTTATADTTADKPADTTGNTRVATTAGPMPVASPTDAATLVARYTAARRLDRAATVDLTDLMPRVFASRLAPVVLGRGLTLALLDVVPPLRALFARQMMNGRR